jgi:hypothetical protein
LVVVWYRDHVRTIMVKAAPRFATILCLCYVRADAACPLGGWYLWFGNCNAH